MSERIPSFRLWVIAAVSLVDVALGHDALAQSCPSLSANIDFARTSLQRAAKATDLEDGKNYARRAKNDLEDAEMAATQCGCLMAASEFDDAARRAKRARDADEADAFADELRRAIRNFNGALQALRSCDAPRRR